MNVEKEKPSGPRETIARGSQTLPCKGFQRVGVKQATGKGFPGPEPASRSYCTGLDYRKILAPCGFGGFFRFNKRG